MNSREYLLVCLIEELSEIQYSASKALRFGLDEGHPDNHSTNADDIRNELIDLTAVVSLLEASGVIPIISQKELAQKIRAKKAKLLKYSGYSIARGILKKDNSA